MGDHDPQPVQFPDQERAEQSGQSRSVIEEFIRERVRELYYDYNWNARQIAHALGISVEQVENEL